MNGLACLGRFAGVVLLFLVGTARAVSAATRRQAENDSIVLQ
jgi:hypothetical protein